MTTTQRSTLEHREQGPTTNINMGKRERLASAGGALALAAGGLLRRGWLGLGMALAGLPLLLRSVTGHSFLYDRLGVNRSMVRRDADVSVPHQQGIRVEESVTINRSPAELYTFWRNFENLPRVMKNVESVLILSPTRSHWIVKGPAGRTVEWDAEIVTDVQNERIAWRSLKHAQVDNAGTVLFQPAPGDQGTEVHVVLEYAPPGGVVGSWIAKLFGKEPHHQVSVDLYRFKQLMEVGEIATTDGQPSGRESEDSRPLPEYRKHEAAPKDVVQQASEESFPASDAPGYY